jgi:hypothetical protein
MNSADINIYPEIKIKPFKTSNDIGYDNNILINQTMDYQNQEQNLDQNLEQNLDQNQEQNLDQNQEQNLDQNQEQNLDQNQEQNLKQKPNESKQRKVVFDENVKVKFIEKSNSKYNSSTTSNFNTNAIHEQMYNAFNYTDPDFINPDDELNDKDPTDIKDDDEQEILEDNDSDTDTATDETKTEYDYLIQKLFNTFLNKFPHLDNYKNKSIIYSMFKIAVLQMPDHKDSPVFYLNFVESSIKQLTVPDLNDVISNGIVD